MARSNRTGENMNARSVAVASLLVSVLLVTPCLGQEGAKPLVTDAVYTKPQQLVNVGHGRRMNLYCLGSGSPTVILDAGMGDSTISWALVQPAIATKTRACSYDRAGLGFSDGSHRPSSASNTADDLHTLLKAARVAPPYVLVGHSAAGMYIRVYADRYPDEVVGMVSVEGSHEDQWVRGWAIGAPGQQAKWDDFLKEYGSCVAEAKRGLVAGTPAYKKCVGDPDPRFSPAINEAQARYASTVRWQAAAASERQAVAYASADQTRTTRKHYGDMPIIVLTHSPYPKAKDETQEERNQRTLLWESLHLDVAAMSSRGVNEVVPNSGHYIQYDHPQVVIDAVNQAVAIARDQLSKQ
jgi:pimeloyl-ACP methyl ester carboxylesterase